jgi:hypothetical protein
MSLSEKQKNAEPWCSRTVTSGRWWSPFIPSGREANSAINQLSTSGASNLLKMALLLSKTFRTFTDLLKYQFKLLPFF